MRNSIAELGFLRDTFNGNGKRKLGRSWGGQARSGSSLPRLSYLGGLAIEGNSGVLANQKPEDKEHSDLGQ